jgi:hypothetical protein
LTAVQLTRSALGEPGSVRSVGLVTAATADETERLTASMAITASRTTSPRERRRAVGAAVLVTRRA